MKYVNPFGFSTSPVAQCEIVQQNDVLNPKENELIILSGFNTSPVAHFDLQKKRCIKSK